MAVPLEGLQILSHNTVSRIDRTQINSAQLSSHVTFQLALFKTDWLCMLETAFCWQCRTKGDDFKYVLVISLLLNKENKEIVGTCQCLIKEIRYRLPNKNTCQNKTSNLMSCNTFVKNKLNDPPK